jgi:hypothetical protein
MKSLFAEEVVCFSPHQEFFTVIETSPGILRYNFFADYYALPNFVSIGASYKCELCS